jgi:AbrB family looped-hinge helix DNA binding protein
MSQATISSRGWIVIPADLRRKYELTPGKKVQVVDYGGVISLVPVSKDPIQSSKGQLIGRSFIDR